MKKTIKQAILDAAAWLRANPDKHIAGQFALTKPFGDGGRVIAANAPGATCFCAYGRVMHELGIDTSDTKEDRKLALAMALDYGKVWRLNDSASSEVAKEVGVECSLDAERSMQALGQPCVIDYLEKVAETL